MPTKQEVYDSIQETQTYRGSEVKHLIYSIKLEPERPKSSLSKVMVGDVFITGGLNTAKTRPSIVVKVLRDKVLYLSMSTTEDYMNLVPHNCRVFKQGFINMALGFNTVDFVKENFIGIFTDRKALKEAIKLVKHNVNLL